jgi:hypothetical protein
LTYLSLFAILRNAFVDLHEEVGRMIRRAVVLWLVLVSAVFSQAKVGTTGAQFLELPLSARSAGMGNIGTVLTESRSYLINPATLGFIAPCRTSVQFDPLVPDLGAGISYYSLAAATRIGTAESGHPSIGVGVRFLRLSSGQMIERTYERGVDDPGRGVSGTGRTYAWTDSKVGLAVGLGWSGAIDFGAGVGLNYIREDVHDYHADSWSADLGVYFGIPLGTDHGSSFMPPRILVGAAMCNIGPDLKFIEKAAPMPRYLRLGYGVELVWRDGDRERLRLLPAIEYQRGYGGAERETTNLGLEAWVHELLCGRIGYLTSARVYKDQTTWGLGFSTVGLRSHPRGDEAGSGSGFLGSIVDDVDVELSFAHQGEIFEGGDGTDYYGVELMF